MERIRIFRYLPEVDAFTWSDDYQGLCEAIGLLGWDAGAWLGRLLHLDNDVGEHLFDREELQDCRRVVAERYGLDSDDLLIPNPAFWFDGADGPCHSTSMRMAFWRDVLSSLKLSVDLIFAEAVRNNEIERDLEGREGVIRVGGGRYLPDLDQRFEQWRRTRSG